MAEANQTETRGWMNGERSVFLGYWPGAPSCTYKPCQPGMSRETDTTTD